MPEILEIIKKYTGKTEHDSPEFIKELTEKVGALYNLGIINGTNFTAQRMIEFIQTGK